MNDHEAFVYRWRELSTNKWYIGYHKGTSDDGYVSSNSLVNEKINNFPNDWERKVLRYGTKLEMIKLENQILKSLKSIRNPQSYNKSHGFPTEAIGAGRPKGKLDPFRYSDLDPISNTPPNTPPKTNKPKISSRGGARAGAGRPRGSVYPLHKILSLICKYNIAYECEFNSSVAKRLTADKIKITISKIEG